MDEMQAQDYKDRYEHQYEMKCKALDEGDALLEALRWCSGSGDFAPGGKARRGWLRVCKPLLA